MEGVGWGWDLLLVSHFLDDVTNYGHGEERMSYLNIGTLSFHLRIWEIKHSFSFPGTNTIKSCTTKVIKQNSDKALHFTHAKCGKNN